MTNKKIIIEPIYDYLRVISCIFVIGIHAKDNVIFRIGLPMFVLLSGILILNGKEEKLSEFYFKRFVKIIIPFLIYSLFYVFVMVYKFDISFFSISNLYQSIKVILKTHVVIPLWYVYMILGIYLCTPFLKKMCKSLNKNDCKNLFLLLLFISFISYSLPWINFPLGINNIVFYDWVIIFLLGYLITKKEIYKHYKLIYFLGVISGVFTFFVIKNNLYLDHIYDVSITMIFQVLAFFLLFYRNKKVICKYDLLNKIMRNISKYSFEIYLIHSFYALGFNKYNINSIFLIFISSYITAIVVNKLIITPIQKVCVLIYKKIQSIYKETKQNKLLHSKWG